MAGRLSGKTIAVTGGTKGIGEGIAALSVAEDANVVIGGRDRDAGRRVVEELSVSKPGRIRFCEMNVTKVDDCRRFIDLTVSTFGRIDGLVNNAGVFPRGSIEDTTEDLYDSVMAVNAKGSFFCAQFAVNAMVETGGGSIVNIGSTHAFKGSRQLAAYACSKGALHSLTTYLAVNYAQHGIRSNWVTIGWVASPGEVERFEKMGKSREDLEAMARERVPSGRLQTVLDNAYAVVYLLSDESAQVTGTEIHVTGGFNY